MTDYGTIDTTVWLFLSKSQSFSDIASQDCWFRLFMSLHRTPRIRFVALHPLWPILILFKQLYRFICTWCQKREQSLIIHKMKNQRRKHLNPTPNPLHCSSKLSSFIILLATCRLLRHFGVNGASAFASQCT